MEILEENEVAKLVSLGCQPVFDCTQQLHPCTKLVYCPDLSSCSVLCSTLHPCTTLKCIPLCSLFDCGTILKCDGPFIQHVTDDLTACGDEFYNRCSKFADIGEDCQKFGPALDATKLKEKITLEKISKLESKVEELEASLKKKI